MELLANYIHKFISKFDNILHWSRNIFQWSTTTCDIEDSGVPNFAPHLGSVAKYIHFSTRDPNRSFPPNTIGFCQTPASTAFSPSFLSSSGELSVTTIRSPREAEKSLEKTTVDGSKIRLTTKDDDYPIIYRVLYIPGGTGFLPSTVPLTNLLLQLHAPSRSFVKYTSIKKVPM